MLFICPSSFTFAPSLISYLLHASSFFFFNDAATTEIYTLSLHDVFRSHLHDQPAGHVLAGEGDLVDPGVRSEGRARRRPRSEEHTSELQSLTNLVCRLLLEKKK